MLTSLKNILEHARAHRYAVPAFDCVEDVMVRTILETAQELHAPVILMGLPADLQGNGMTYVPGLIRAVADHHPIPVALHLDHATDLRLVQAAIDRGFTSVMVDGSNLPFDENVAFTRAAVELAHPHGISVEGELGHVGGMDLEETACAESVLTEPAEVARFVEETRVRRTGRIDRHVTRGLSVVAQSGHGSTQATARGQLGSTRLAWWVGDPRGPNPRGSAPWHLQIEYLRRLSYRDGTRIAASSPPDAAQRSLAHGYFWAHQGRTLTGRGRQARVAVRSRQSLVNGSRDVRLLAISDAYIPRAYMRDGLEPLTRLGIDIQVRPWEHDSVAQLQEANLSIEQGGPEAIVLPDDLLADGDSFDMLVVQFAPVSRHFLEASKA